MVAEWSIVPELRFVGTLLKQFDPAKPSASAWCTTHLLVNITAWGSCREMVFAANFWLHFRHVNIDMGMQHC